MEVPLKSATHRFSVLITISIHKNKFVGKMLFYTLSSGVTKDE
jgi:hypothetical protein